MAYVVLSMLFFSNLLRREIDIVVSCCVEVVRVPKAAMAARPTRLESAVASTALAAHSSRVQKSVCYYNRQTAPRAR